MTLIEFDLARMIVSGVSAAIAYYIGLYVGRRSRW